MFRTCFGCGRCGQVLQSHPLPISPLPQTPEWFLCRDCKFQGAPSQRAPLTSSRVALDFLIFPWFFTGTRPPPHPSKCPSRIGGVCVQRGGGVRKFLPWGGLEIYIPTPLPWKMPYGQNWEGRGYIISPWGFTGFESASDLWSGGRNNQSSIAVEDAVENRGFYRVFVLRLF